MQVPLLSHYLSEDSFFEFLRNADASEFLDFFNSKALLGFELADD